VATASARRAAGSDSNVVGLRRRRSRRLLYGLSGVAAAMAASLVFYVGLSSDQPFRFQSPREAPEAPAASGSVAPPGELNDDSRLNQIAGPTRPPAAEADAAKTESSGVAQQQFSGGSIQAANEPAASGTQSAAPAPTAATSPTSGADEEYREALPLRRDEQASADAAEAQRQREIAVEELEKSAAVAVDTAAPTPPPAAPFGLTHPVAALLIIDPGLAPPGLRQEDYPIGNLPARLGEARRLAEGQAIAALVTLRVDDRIVDAVIRETAKTKGLSVTKSAAQAESTSLGPVAPGYELMELDGR
jgi:hypothetical protein